VLPLLIGLSRTHGELPGDRQVSDGLKNKLELERVFAVLLKNQFTPPGTECERFNY